MSACEKTRQWQQLDCALDSLLLLLWWLYLVVGVGVVVSLLFSSIPVVPILE